MTKKHIHSESAAAYMRLELSSGQDLEQRLGQKIMIEKGSIYSFLPDHVIDSADLECLDTDILQLTGKEQGEIDLLDAEVIYQFVKSDRNAAFIVVGLKMQNFPSFPRLRISVLKSISSNKTVTYVAVSLNEGTVEAVEEFLDHVPTRRLVSCLAYLPAGVTDSAEVVEMDESLADSIVVGCRHVILGSYDYYSRLFWSSSTSLPDHQTVSVAPQTAAPAYVALSQPARLGLDRSLAFYFQQRLCNTLWRSWVKPYAGGLRDSGSFWCLAPISPDPYFACKLGASFRVAYPKSSELRLRQARNELFEFFGQYLNDRPNAFMVTRGDYVWWPESNPLPPGRSADGAFRIVVNSDYKYQQNRENWYVSYVFKAILAGLDTIKCIEQAWQLLPGLSCCAIIDAPGDPFDLIRDDRFLTMEELEENLRPATTHVIVGGFRNELPIVWSKETIA